MGLEVLPPMRLLAVDDDLTVLQSLQSLQALLAPAHELSVARSGERAIELARIGQPELILLDIGLPDMDGYAVCTALKADPLTDDIPVIFLTGHDDLDAEIRGLDCGASDFILKPPRGPVVLARIRNLVQARRLARQLRQRAETDGLTGIANRRRFDAALQTEVLRALREGQPLGVLMIDIDHFKAYNDAYGHLAGDQALQAVAGVLAHNCRRPGDLCARYGGEEFVMLLPQTDVDGAVSVAHQALEQVLALDIAHKGNPVQRLLSMSVGAAALDPELVNARRTPAQHQRVALTAGQALLEAADQALFEAKRAGRARVVRSARLTVQTDGAEPSSLWAATPAQGAASAGALGVAAARDPDARSRPG